MNVKKVWDARKQILEGIRNNVFKSEAIEAIAEERNKICMACDQYDTKGDSCLVPGTQPCCGACGCSLKLKQRSLSSGCDQGSPRRFGVSLGSRAAETPRGSWATGETS